MLGNQREVTLCPEALQCIASRQKSQGNWVMLMETRGKG